jgi:hypothetical protein
VRSALHAARLPQQYWTYAVKDVVDKSNATPQVNCKPSPATIFDHCKAPPDYFLPFGKTGRVTVTSHKTRLAPRAGQMRYLHALNRHQYQVLYPQNKKSCTVRSSELHPDWITTKPQHSQQQRARPCPTLKRSRMREQARKRTSGENLIQTHCDAPTLSSARDTTTISNPATTASPILLLSRPSAMS